MLDVAVAPDFATSREVYITFSEGRGRGRTGTSLARMKLEGRGNDARLTDRRIIFRQQPAYHSGHHFGSRIVFAPDGNAVRHAGRAWAASAIAEPRKQHLRQGDPDQS